MTNPNDPLGAMSALKIGAQSDDPTPKLDDGSVNTDALNLRHKSGNQFARATFAGDGVRYEQSSGVVRGYSHAEQHGPIVSIRAPNGGGSQSIADATPNSIITLANGAELTIKDALRIGAISRSDLGSAYGAGVVGTPGNAPATNPPADLNIPIDGNHQGDDQAAAAAPEEHPDLKTEVTASPEAENVLTGIAQNTNANTQLEAVEQVATTGDVGDATVESLATQLNTEPEKVRALINDTIRPAFEAQARSAIGAVVGDPQLVEAAVDWLRDNRQKEVGDAVRRQLMNRNTQGFKQLANEFLENLDTVAPDALLSAELTPGWSAFHDKNGKVVLRTPQGQTVEWRSAVRAGFVSFGPRK